MVKKVTLYLGNDLFSSIQELRALYLFGGSYVSDLPDVSDVIEASIYYERFYIVDNPKEVDIIQKYVSPDGQPEDLPKQDTSFLFKGSGRLLFAIKENIQSDLDFIRQTWNYMGTDPLLIRDILDRVFNEHTKRDIFDWGLLFLKTYIGHLYGLKLRESLILSLCGSGKLPLEVLTKSFAAPELDILREIALDEGRIERLETIIQGGHLRDKSDGILGIERDDYDQYKPLMYNKEYTFNFIDAYVGFAIVMKELIKTKTRIDTAPSFVELLRMAITDPNDHKFVKDLFIKELKGALDLSDQLNKHL
ncbi:MAG: hypothetical protein M1113_01600 [Candidatus Thermoplasmatota archaeon]|nr:hypothetical protein [Candidatus Thermoplasmatota archaeon]